MRKPQKLGGRKISRRAALKGLGDPKTWAKHKEKVEKEFREKPVCPCHPPKGVPRTCSLHVYLCADEMCDCNCDRGTA